MVSRFLRAHGVLGRGLGAALLLAVLPGEALPCQPFCPYDGRSDILLTGVSGWYTLPLARSNGDGTFSVTNPWVGDFGAWAANPNAVKLTGDFNGDGWTDVALTGVAGWNTLPIAFNNGDGTFNVSNEYIGEFAGWAAASGVVPLVGDFNGDGRSDIALTGHPGWATVPVALSDPYYPGQFLVDNGYVDEFAWAANTDAVKLVGDFNGDGRSDIALTGVPGWQSVPVAFADEVSGAFRRYNVTNFLVDDFAGWAAMPGVAKLGGDFDGNGFSDILLVGGAGWSSLRVAFSDGDGSFTVANVTDPNWGWVGEYVSWPDNQRLTGDFNGDGRTDVAFRGSVVGEWGWVVWLFVGVAIGDGSFSWESSAFDSSDLFTCLATPGVTLVTGDFDGDSRTDFAITGVYCWGSIPLLLSRDSYFHCTYPPVADFPTWAERPGRRQAERPFQIGPPRHSPRSPPSRLEGGRLSRYALGPRAGDGAAWPSGRGRSPRAADRDQRKVPYVPLRARHLLQGAAAVRPRRGQVALRRGRQEVPGLLRRDPDRQPGPLRPARGRRPSRSRPARSSTCRRSTRRSRSSSWPRRWRGLFPGEKPAKCFFTNSGTEANETAILTAQRPHAAQRDHRAAPRLLRRARCSRSRSPAHAPWRLVPTQDRAASSTPWRRTATAARSSSSTRELRHRLREGHRGAHPDRRPRAGSPRFIAEPILGVGGFITPPQGVLRDRGRHRPEATAASSSATRCRRASAAPAASGSASSSTASSPTS